MHGEYECGDIFARPLSMHAHMHAILIAYKLLSIHSGLRLNVLVRTQPILPTIKFFNFNVANLSAGIIF